MATDRVTEWVKETKSALLEAEVSNGVATSEYHLLKAVVFALLTIAIAIHEAAATKKVK